MKKELSPNLLIVKEGTLRRTDEYRVGASAPSAFTKALQRILAIFQGGAFGCEVLVRMSHGKPLSGDK